LNLCLARREKVEKSSPESVTVSPQQSAHDNAGSSDTGCVKKQDVSPTKSIRGGLVADMADEKVAADAFKRIFKRPNTGIISNSAPTSSNSSRETISSGEYWSCFICHKRIRNDNDLVNMHVSACLERQELKDQQAQAQRARKPTVSSEGITHDDDDEDEEGPERDVFIKFPTTSLTYSQFGIRECIFSIIPGLILIPEFITEFEEAELIQKIDADSHSSWEHTNWTGHMTSKRFGMVTVFGIPRSNDYVNAKSIERGTAHKRSGEIRGIRVNDESAGEYGLPDYSQFVVDRLYQLKKDILELLYERIRHDATHKSKHASAFDNQRRIINTQSLIQLVDSLKVFVPNECNVNCYLKSRGDFLRPHFDDRELSGPLLMNLSLCGKAAMRYTLDLDDNKTQTSHKLSTSRYSNTLSGLPIVDENKLVVDVPLPRRCLQLISGEGRYKWEHSIPTDFIHDERRVSITWRGAGIKSRNKGSLVL
jgi:alkylated DNA repair dioxygenase AlkB